MRSGRDDRSGDASNQFTSISTILARTSIDPRITQWHAGSDAATRSRISECQCGTGDGEKRFRGASEAVWA